MKRLLTILTLCLPLVLSAEDLEYKMDIGGGLGLSHYWGDASTGTSVMGAVTSRRNFNPHMSLKMSIAVGGVKGNTEGWYFPENAYEAGDAGGARLKEYSFSRTVLDFGEWAEELQPRPESISPWASE